MTQHLNAFYIENKSVNVHHILIPVEDKICAKQNQYEFGKVNKFYNKSYEA